MSPHSQKYFKYRGRSMWPTFQEGDLLEIEPVNFDQLLAGDCILFPDRTGQLVVHRLIGMHNGLRTRGDATAIPDPDPVKPDAVMGRVTCCHRLGRINRVIGGRLGRLAAPFFRYAGRIDPDRPSHGGRIARIIQGCSSTLLKPVLKSGKVRTLQIQDQGAMVVWQLREKVIGRMESDGRWVVCWPWRVFIKLPRMAEKG